MVEVDFLSGPEMKGIFTAPSHEIARDKEQFGASRKARWFGTNEHHMSMWKGQRIQQVDVTDADAGREHNVLLDVRNADEWEAGHAPGAKWVPLGELEGARFSLPINRRIVCVCRSGARSDRAAAELVSDGIRRREHDRRHEGVARARAPRRTRRRFARRGDLKDAATTRAGCSAG